MYADQAFGGFYITSFAAMQSNPQVRNVFVEARPTHFLRVGKKNDVTPLGKLLRSGLYLLTILLEKEVHTYVSNIELNSEALGP